MSAWAVGSKANRLGSRKRYLTDCEQICQIVSRYGSSLAQWLPAVRSRLTRCKLLASLVADPMHRAQPILERSWQQSNSWPRSPKFVHASDRRIGEPRRAAVRVFVMCQRTTALARPRPYVGMPYLVTMQISDLHKSTCLTETVANYLTATMFGSDFYRRRGWYDVPSQSASDLEMEYGGGAR